jgi:hypothetical protein
LDRIYWQGYWDSLCGVYSLLNADQIVNNSTEEESQILFNSIVQYLAKKRQLKDVILDGTNHTLMQKMLDNAIGDRIPIRITNRKNITSLKEWWNYSQEFISYSNRSIIISLGGKTSHYSVAKSMTDKVIQLADSNGRGIIRKSACKMQGYEKEDRYVIYPSQCIYLGKE